MNYSYELAKHDLRFVIERLPRDIRDLLSTHANKLFVGGGFIRDVISGNTPTDIDLFGGNAEWLENVAAGFLAMRPEARMHKSKNAITIVTPNRITIQFITRWVFDDPRKLVESFDFTVCQAGIWRGGPSSSDPWRSQINDRFYQDLAARRLYYTSPKREEEAGGSLLRVLKFVRRGYSIQVSSLGEVIGRVADEEKKTKKHWSEILREVDPLLMIDGMEFVDDHEAADPLDAAIQAGNEKSV